MRVLVSAWFADARQYVVFDQIDQRVGYGSAVIVEAASCEFAVDIVETLRLAEPLFFPEFLDDSFACFSAWRWRWALGYLSEACGF